MNPIFRGRVEKGILRLAPGFYAYLGSLEGLEVEVVVRKKRSKRSDQQNRYYWGVVVKMIADHCGYTPEEMHEALKFKVLGSESPDDHGLVKIRSTAALSTDEFSQYVNKVVQFAAMSLGVFIPDPSMVDY
jgi:hypothetical protein